MSKAYYNNLDVKAHALVSLKMNDEKHNDYFDSFCYAIKNIKKMRKMRNKPDGTLMITNKKVMIVAFLEKNLYNLDIN